MANRRDRVPYFRIGFTVHFEKEETRTPLSEQLAQKCHDLSDQLDNLGIASIQPDEGGTRLIIFLKSAVAQPDTQTILDLLAPLTPTITFSPRKQCD